MRKNNKIRLFFSKWSIRKKLALALGCMAAMMVVFIGFVSYQLAMNKVMEMSVNLSENNTQTAGQILSRYLQSVNNVTLQLALLPSLRDIAGNPDPLPQEVSSAASSISFGVRSALNASASDGVRFGYVGIFLANGYEYSSSQAFAKEYTDYNSCLKYLYSCGIDPNDNYIRPTWVDAISFYDSDDNRQTSGLVTVRFIYDSSTMVKQGIILSVIMEKQLCDIYSGYTSNAFIMDTKGKILSSPSKSDIGTQCPDNILSDFLMNSAKHYKVKTYVSKNGNKLVTFFPTMENRAFLVVPFDYYTNLSKQEMGGYIRNVLGLILLGILIAVGLALLISKSLSRSILDLAAFMKRVNGESFEERFPSRGHDEVAYLAEKTNHMLDQIQQSARIREEDLKIKQQLEIRLLQSQINPHLLYNTLNSVLRYVQQGNARKSEEIIMSLSEFFRSSLARGKMEIPLKDELKLITHYIDIQRLARQREIAIICKIEPDLYAYPIVKLTLQPIIENSILHGFAGYKDSEGSIEICASHTDDTFEIIVKDNGIGLLPEELQTLNDSLDTYPPPANLKSFGLYNVNRRIAQTYGEKYGIHVESEITAYTAVILTMPYNKNRSPREEKHV